MHHLGPQGPELWEAAPAKLYLGETLYAPVMHDQV